MSRDDQVRTSSPRRPPVATGPALVVAVLLVGLAVVVVHDLAAQQGWTSDQGWGTVVARDLDGLVPTWRTTLIGVALVVVGAALAWTSLGPGRRTHRPTPMDDGDVWISTRALRRLAEDAAWRTTGVESAQVRVRRRSLQVRATYAVSGTPPAELRDHLAENVTRALEGFNERPVRVRTKAAPDVT